ncbi:DUF2971 domain-containing protein [Lysobacter soli]|uniref:DUF2971 domain-containing protein n=1 Tax=Lysobacter soli TaxID=453783 RepID=UPI0037C9203D
MRDLDDFFASNVDRTLYHYTGIGALLGIVEHKRVWASHAYYLNDSREILHACDVLRALVLERAEQCSDIEREFLEQLHAWLKTFDSNAYHVYIFSLSEERSLLSQWRSYTPHGKGVSLGFSAATLNSMLREQNFRIAKCRYANHEHRELLEVLLDKLLITFNQGRSTIDVMQNHPSQKYFKFLEDYRNDFLQVLSVIKHPSFKEEAEWRVISPYYPNYTVPEIRYREGASMLLPYIHVDIQRDDGGPLFDEVLLGPSRDNELSMSALSNFLRKAGASPQTVSCGIPFRKW